MQTIRSPSLRGQCWKRDGALRIALPSSLHALWVGVLQTTVTAVMSPRSGGDVAAACVAITVAAVPLLLLGAVPYYVQHCLQLTLAPHTSAHAGDGQPFWVSLWTSLWTRSSRWVCAEDSRTVPPKARCVWLVLLDCRVLWYPALDAAVLTAVSAAAAASVAAGSARACQSVAVGALLVYLLQLVVVLLVDPFTIPAAHVVTVVTLVLSCVCALLQVMVLFDVGPADDLLTLFTALQLLALGIGVLKLCFDAWNAVRALLRFVRDLSLCSVGGSDAEGTPPCVGINASCADNVDGAYAHEDNGDITFDDMSGREYVMELGETDDSPASSWLETSGGHVTVGGVATLVSL